MKSIKTKITFSMTLIVVFSLLIVGGVSVYLNVESTNNTLTQSMTFTAGVTAERIAQELAAYKNVAYETGSIPALSAAETSVEQIQAIVKQRADVYGFLRGDVIATNGISRTNGKDFSSRNWFQGAIKGTTFMSEPVTSKVTGERVFAVSAPLWKDGIANSQVVGVVYFVPTETFLDDIMKTIKVSANGGSYLLDSGGNIIAHPNPDFYDVNYITAAQSDNALKTLAQLQEKQIKGETGFGSYTLEGHEKFLAYSPISGTSGWTVGITSPIGDFMGETALGAILTAVLLVVAVVVSIIIAKVVAGRISTPIRACADRMRLLSQGDLTAAVPTVKTNDETKILSDATRTLVEGMNLMINDVDNCLSEMSDGNFAVRTNAEDSYVGNFQNLLISMRKLNKRLNGTLFDISKSAAQVANSSDQVSSGSQALSQGATEQASSVEELATIINELASQTIESAQSAAQASEKASAVGTEITESNQRMQKMLSAMTNINTSSNEIAKIIKTIEDIAFQTNILALNAAVEAARAGTAGKGFAVVADEVRNLASKSAEASKSTSSLIENSLSAVEKGTKMANETAQSLDQVVGGVQEVVEIIGRISAASHGQTQSIKQVTTGVELISNVVQTNSATAEESAATSEELSGQAQLLKNLVAQFTLKVAETTSCEEQKQLPYSSSFTAMEETGKY